MNLEQIAKLSGVSRSTASRVINNDPNVSDNARENVKRIVRLMNYVPNAAARGLAAGRTQVIGLVIPTGVSALFSDPYCSILIQSVSSACNAHNYSVMLWIAQPEYERRQIHQIVRSGAIDGAIIAPTLANDTLVQALLAGSLPFIVIGHYPANGRVNYVDADDILGAHEAVRHLLRMGRTRIATITGPQNTITGIDRLMGYMHALRECGLPVESDLIAAGGFSEGGGYIAMQQLLPHRPDAVFAANDIMAMGALRAIRDTGLRVPQDIAVVAFDDTPLAARAEPPLTTIHRPTHQVGNLAVETLIEMIEYPKSSPYRIMLPTELIIRSSCGAAFKEKLAC
ncbi:MAG TPA: LacI family DNA-binding transcriptional regulator [Anaerolineae bacterium]